MEGGREERGREGASEGGREGGREGDGRRGEKLGYCFHYKVENTTKTFLKVLTIIIYHIIIKLLVLHMNEGKEFC